MMLLKFGIVPQYYINIKSAAFPSGEIRGQLDYNPRSKYSVVLRRTLPSLHSVLQVYLMAL